MLIHRLTKPVIELKERMAVQAFAKGFAEKYHYDTLLDMQGVLLLAGASAKHRNYIYHYADQIIGKVLIGIRDRYDKTSKLGCSGKELTILKEFPDNYQKFWERQPTELYIECVAKLQEYYLNMKEEENGKQATA